MIWLNKRLGESLLLILIAFPCIGAPVDSGQAPKEVVYPAEHWASRTPEQLGLSRDKLDALRKLVGGRGCVVRHGCMAYTWGDQHKSSDVASAMKPVLSTLMLMAVSDGKIGGMDERVSRFEPRLKALNGEKDDAITWRHLASQTSGYGLVERPGQAWSYNDFALALYYDTLMDKVYRQSGTTVLKARLAGPLQFEDEVTFEAFGPNNRRGRLAISVRDFARFGLLCLRGGRWGERQLIDAELFKSAISSPVPVDVPLTSGREADMLPGQRSVGGGKNITPVGPGYYSFNWWLNREDAKRPTIVRRCPARHVRCLRPWRSAHVVDHPEPRPHRVLERRRRKRPRCEPRQSRVQVQPGGSSNQRSGASKWRSRGGPVESRSVSA